MRFLSIVLVLVFFLTSVTTVFSQTSSLIDMFSQQELPTLQEVQTKLNSNVEVNIKNQHGYSPLGMALERKANTKIINALINAGANVNNLTYQGYTPLFAAIIRKASVETIIALIKAGANINQKFTKGYTPLFLAIETQSSELVISALIEAGADVKCKRFDGITVLMRALMVRAPLAIIEKLLEGGASINDKTNINRKPLFFAAYTNASLEVLKKLVDKGAQVNAKDKLGKTPFMMLCAMGKEKNKIDCFLKAGANIKDRDKTGSTPIFYAIANNDLKIVKHLLKNGADLEAKDFMGATVLHSAIEDSGNFEIIEFLVKSGISLKTCNEAGETPLMLAKRLQQKKRKFANYRNKNLNNNKKDKTDYKKIRKLLNANKSLKVSPSNKNLALPNINKVKKTKPYEVLPNSKRFLLNSKKIRGKNSKFSKLMRALYRKKDTNKILELIHAGNDLEKRDFKGNTPLIWAIEHKCKPEIVIALVKAGADLNVRNKEQHSVLSAAIENRFGIEVINELIKAGADVNKLARNSVSPLHVAISFKNIEAGKALIQAGANINVRRENTLGSPLLEAAKSRLDEIVEKLIKNGAEIEAKDISLNTPLLNATGNKRFNSREPFNPSVALRLLKAGADINAINNKGKTPLSNAVEVKSKVGVEFVQKLLIAGANPNTKDFTSNTILHNIASNYNDKGISSLSMELFEMLIHNGANVNLKNGNGLPPITLASNYGNLEFVECLIKAGVNINLTSSAVANPLILILNNLRMSGNEYLESRRDKTARILVNAGVKLPISQSEKNKYLMQAVKKKKTFEIVSILLKSGADPYHVSKTRHLKISPIEYVLKYGSNPELIKLLKKSDVNLEKRDSSFNNTALHNVLGFMGQGEPAKVKALIDSGADVNAVNGEGSSALAVAIANHRGIEIIKMLLKAGADIEKGDKWGSSVLACAVRQKALLACGVELKSVEPSVISFLLEAGAKVNATNNDGNTPLLFADKIFLSMLIKAGANVNAKGKYGNTALMQAVGRRGSLKAVDILIKGGADVNAVDEHGQTVLMHSSSTQDPKVITKLIKEGADINALDHNKSSILMEAVKGQIKLDILQTLIDCGADIGVKDKDGRNLLMIVSERSKKTHLIELFLKKGFDINAQDNLGNTALFYASKKNIVENVDKLLKAGADANIVNNLGQSIFNNVIKDNRAWINQKNKLEVILKLIKAGININAKNKNRNTPLFYAVEYCKKPSVIKAMLKAGAQINDKNKRLDTPLMRAVMFRMKKPARQQRRKETRLKIFNDAIKSFNKSFTYSMQRYNLFLKLYLSKTLAEKRNMRKSLKKANRNYIIERRKYQWLFDNGLECYKIIKILLESGAKVNEVDIKGETALMKASKYCILPDILVSLIDAGAKLDVVDKKGQTSLIKAAKYSVNPKIINILLEKGASISPKDKDGKNAFNYAIANPALKDTSVLKLLK